MNFFGETFIGKQIVYKTAEKFIRGEGGEVLGCGKPQGGRYEAKKTF